MEVIGMILCVIAAIVVVIPLMVIILPLYAVAAPLFIFLEWLIDTLKRKYLVFQLKFEAKHNRKQDE